MRVDLTDGISPTICLYLGGAIALGSVVIAVTGRFVRAAPAAPKA